MASRKVRKAWRIRWYPTGTQRRQLPRIFGACRWLKGHALDIRSSAYRHYKLSLKGADISGMLTGWKKTAGHKWLTEIPATCLIQALRDLDAAFSNFFAGRAKYPKRPRRGNRESVRFQGVSASQWKAGVLSLPKIGVLRTAEPLPAIQHIPERRRKKGFVGPLKPHDPVCGPAMVTITREPSGEYYVSFTAEVEVEDLPATGTVVGIDLGVHTLATLSTGEKVHYGTKWKAKQRYLKRCQRALARCQKGSNRRRRARVRVAKAHAKIRDHRNYHLHKLTTRMVREHDVICIEDLNVKGLARGFLSSQIQDAAFGEFRRQLTYKAQWYGKELIVVDRYFASSKICSTPGCGHVNSELRLKDREWECPSCGAHHDRDLNAAKSIEAEGLRALGAGRICEAGPLALPAPRPGCRGPGNGRQDARGRSDGEQPPPQCSQVKRLRESAAELGGTEPRLRQ